MSRRIGQIARKAVSIAQHLAEKRHAAPAKAMPNDVRFRRSKSPMLSCVAEMMREDAGFD
jgi:hypothetical protein